MLLRHSCRRRVRRLGGTGRWNTGVSGTDTDRLCQGRGYRLLMRPSPHVVHVIGSHLTLLVDRSVVLSGMVSLRMYLRHRGWLRSVLVRGASDLLSRPSLEYGRVVGPPGVRVF